MFLHFEKGTVSGRHRNKHRAQKQALKARLQAIHNLCLKSRPACLSWCQISFLVNSGRPQMEALQKQSRHVQRHGGGLWIAKQKKNHHLCFNLSASISPSITASLCGCAVAGRKNAMLMSRLPLGVQQKTRTFFTSV